MIELFTDIPQDVKSQAEYCFNLSLNFNNPMQSAEMLDNFIKYYEAIHPEYCDFIRFYFNIRLEALKNEDTGTVG